MNPYKIINDSEVNRFNVINRKDNTKLGFVEKINPRKWEAFDHEGYTLGMNPTRDAAAIALYKESLITTPFMITLKTDDEKYPKPELMTIRDAYKTLLSANKDKALAEKKAHFYVGSGSNWRTDEDIFKAVADVLIYDLKSAQSRGLASTSCNVFYVPLPDKGSVYEIDNYRPVDVDAKFYFSLNYSEWLHSIVDK